MAEARKWLEVHTLPAALQLGPGIQLPWAAYPPSSSMPARVEWVQPCKSLISRICSDCAFAQKQWQIYSARKSSHARAATRILFGSLRGGRTWRRHRRVERMLTKNWGFPTDLLTNQTVLDPTVHGHASKAPLIGTESTSIQKKVVVLPTTSQILAKYIAGTSPLLHIKEGCSSLHALACSATL
jgi:hypothetical protein